MKRITKLEISNFRAFFDSYEIELNKGENLLIYGENGSGKSSLFKSVSNFLSSSHDPNFKYVHNHNNGGSGNITFTFNDYDLAANAITSSFGNLITFGTAIVNTGTETFVKTAELTKGFLDYKVLLAVYNHTEAQPNLYDLLINILFRDFTPVHFGSTYPLGKRTQQLIRKVTTAHNRATYDYRDGIPELARHEVLLRKVLKEVFLQLNAFLIKYFKLNLRVWYSLTPLQATGWWRNIPTELRLIIKLNGNPVEHQSDYLNEARLSALAICLYLSVIKRNPQPIDYKVLFLDDVFIGLDLSNRIPILDIIKNEFSDYQVFISTYDRHLYELAKRKFETEIPCRWKSIEMYAGKAQINNQPIEKPILVVGESHFEKGTQYLHNTIKPDYPATANYFRKALEELIQDFIPKWETADAENKQIPGYKLGTLIYKARNFLSKTNNSTKNIDSIISFLPTLLHPLSHHEISSPIYKGELQTIEKQIQLWSAELKSLNIPTKYRASLLASKNTLQIKYVLNASTNKHFFFLIKTNEFLVLINEYGQINCSKVHCILQERWGEENGTKQQLAKHSYSKIEKKSAINNFISLQDAYDRIYDVITNLPGMTPFPKSQNYLDAIEYLDHQGNYQPINTIIVW